MKRPVLSHARCPASPASVVRCSGYTLVEIMVATTLSLILLGAVVRMFGDVGQSITDSRAMLEVSDRLRIAATRLQMDLAGVTVTMNPPRRPENNEGYFEYIEGPVTQATASTYAYNNDVTTAVPDPTVGDFDDILMFTTRSTGRPFVGRCASAANGTITSDVAEVAWFVRGRTLFRRQLLVAPWLNPMGAVAAGFYGNYDVSASIQNGVLVANTLGDLTKRECRFAHPTNTFPYDVTRWQFSVNETPIPTLPTLRECFVWTLGNQVPTPIGTFTSVDFWSNNVMLRPSEAGAIWQKSYAYFMNQIVIPAPPNDHYYLCTVAGTTNSTPPTWPTTGGTVTDGGTLTWKDIGMSTRIADDVILTNVIGFDVKAWDPIAVAYVDLGTGAGRFSSTGQSVGYTKPSGVWTPQSLTRVYDTWSTHYEDVGTFTGDTRAGRANNGFDDQIVETPGGATPANGIVDDDAEKLTRPPYPYPLRGIQVKIRTFEPDSRQILEWTVIQDFLPQ